MPAEDRFGVSWQSDKDLARAKRVTEAMLKMKKMDLAALKKAYDGA